jgi:transcriptional regulator with XRE-family HTH domain
MKDFNQLLATARSSDSYWFDRVKLNAATQLQDLLASASLTQEQYAAKLGVKPPQVSRVLNGLGNPTLETLVKMGRALGYVPRVTFVQEATKTASFDAETDVANIDLDINRVEVKPTCKVIVMPQNRARFSNVSVTKKHLQYNASDMDYRKVA